MKSSRGFLSGLVRQACVVTLLLCSATTIHAFTFPTSSSSIAHLSDIAATSTCSSGGTGFTCNTTCPTRTSYPSKDSLLRPFNSQCNVILPASPTLPDAADESEGKITFSGDVSACPSHNMTHLYSRFSLSVWLYTNCADCLVLSLGSGADVRVGGGKLQIGGKNFTISNTEWTHLVITFSGSLTWFVNGGVGATAETTTVGSSIAFGPKTNLTSPTEVIAFADARLFHSPLTVREIQALFREPILKLPRETECRCPDEAPLLVKNTTGEDYLKCTDVGRSTTVSRLNPIAHPDVFMIDKDLSTFWNSGTVKEARVTLMLGKVFQLSKLTLKGLQTTPDEVVVRLTASGSTTSTLTFKSDCDSQKNCHEADISTSETLMYDFQSVDITTRSDVISITADKVEITFKSDVATFYTVSELELEARCHCFGNDATCEITTDTSYTCTCLSHTRDTHCDTCADEFFRQKHEELTCTMSCDCNLTGSEDNICEEVGGQCTCKANVDPDIGRTCEKCKHNTIRFGSNFTNGCTACDCVPEGIVRCEESDSTCTCKANVETSSGKCAECIQNHYDINNAAGCLPCECDNRGILPDSHCDKTTGKCMCRKNVEGRRCNVCKDRFWDLKNAWAHGCEDCTCNFVGSANLACNKTSGQCPCTDGTSRDMFCKPAILSVEPEYGPMAGGTEVSIVGNLLGTRTSTNVTVSIDDVHQEIIDRNQSVIVIRTKNSSTEKSVEVAIAWTKTGINQPYQRELTQKFTFMPDPVIEVPTTSFKTYASGGCSVDITGQHLTSVYKPMIMIYNNPKSDNRTTVCTKSSETEMTCKTPNVTSYTTAGELTYGFWLDNVADFRDLDSSKTRFEIIPDPEIDTGRMIAFKNTFDKEIEITGQGLSLACDDRDVRVTVGGQDCHVTKRTNHRITCDPGETFPGSSREEEILVHIGNVVVRHGVVSFKSFWTHPAFIGGVSGLGAILLSILIVFAICRLRRRSDSFKRQSGSGHINGGIELDEAKHRAKPNNYDKWPKPDEAPLTAEPATSKRDSREDFMSRLEPSVCSLVTSSMVDRTQIEPGQICTHKGKKIRVILGQFGSATSSSYAGNPIFIKTLVSPYPERESLPSWLGEGLKECTRLQNSVHDNVLRLLGIAVDGKQVYILYPEMTKRTLKDHLTSAKKPFTNDEKLDLCVQVAEGMTFLASDCVVHRDLAARNCWVSQDLTVKIADASFSYDLYPDEYLFQNGRHQPVRWMAPESLRQAGFYTTKADVWSFGVLMWEVFTNGYRPYPEVNSNSEISDYVCNKQYKLGKPALCPDNVWSLMDQCYADKGDARPTFSELLDKITNVISPGDVGGENLYQNAGMLANQEEEEGMELYENTQLGSGGLPPRPPKSIRS